MKLNRIFLQIVVILTFITLNNPIFASVNEIKIDNTNNRLIAPRGEDYQWYYNGSMINGSENQYLNSVKSGEYKVNYIDENGKQATEIIRVSVQQGVIHKIYVIGDSTVATYNDSKYPQKGWGQVLQLYFDNTKYQVVNKAIGGRSSRSFYQDVAGRWTEITSVLAAGDYVFIQFGHNDRDYSKPERYTDTANFKYYLRIYVNDTRAKGAVPVLVSPMIMHAYNGSTLRNVFTEGANDYRGSMLKVAQELNVPFVDLNMKSFNRVKEVGQEYAANYWYLGLLAGEYPNFPTGSSDGTHFQEMGALEMAGLITDGISELSADTNMTNLISALLPRYNISVTMNVPEAGIVTKPGSYPAGTQVTLKTRLKGSYKFSKWEDDSTNLISTNKLYSFITKAQDYNFVAKIADCNGDEGGSAALDKCGYCSGGKTGNIYCSSQYQSESACLYDGIIENETINSVKRTYINTATQKNGGFSYMLSTSKDTTFQMGIIYKSTVLNEAINIKLNDEGYKTLNVDTINAWDTLYFEFEATKGSYHFRIESASETGGILFDNLISSTGGLLKASCNPLDITVVNSEEICVKPNPFQNVTEIKGEGKIEYSIYNNLGIMVDRGLCETSCEIGEDLEKGIYILKLRSNKNNVSRIIVKD